MSSNRRDGSPYRARSVLAALNARGIEQPHTVAQAVAVLDRIEADKPAEPHPQALHDAIVAGATPDELDAIVLRDLGSHRIRTAFEQARLTAAVAVLRAILDARDEIHAHLAEQAATLIGKLEAIAALDDARLDTLIREGRTGDARALADKEIVGQELSELHQLRDLYLTPPASTYGPPASTAPYGLTPVRLRICTAIAALMCSSTASGAAHSCGIRQRSRPPRPPRRSPPAWPVKPSSAKKPSTAWASWASNEQRQAGETARCFPPFPLACEPACRAAPHREEVLHLAGRRSTYTFAPGNKNFIHTEDMQHREPYPQPRRQAPQSPPATPA